MWYGRGIEGKERECRVTESIKIPRPGAFSTASTWVFRLLPETFAHPAPLSFHLESTWNTPLTINRNQSHFPISKGPPGSPLSCSTRKWNSRAAGLDAGLHNCNLQDLNAKGPPRLLWVALKTSASNGGRRTTGALCVGDHTFFTSVPLCGDPPSVPRSLHKGFTQLYCFRRAILDGNLYRWFLIRSTCFSRRSLRLLTRNSSPPIGMSSRNPQPRPCPLLLQSAHTRVTLETIDPAVMVTSALSSTVRAKHAHLRARPSVLACSIYSRD